MSRRVWAVGVSSLAILAGASASRWTATLAPIGTATVAGAATVAEQAPDSLEARVRLTGGRSGMLYPWHLHTGTCEGPGAPLGSGAAYPPVRAGADGAGTGVAHVKAAIAPGTAYSVNVHRSPSDMTVIACGDLQPATNSP